MRYGYWTPVFGGWLRNVDDENMAATWEYASALAIRAEQIGFDLTLVAELNMNDIKGTDAPALDAWTTAAALAAVTKTQEIMVAVRPTFHLPALLAKQSACIDRISGGRLSLNVVASWWADEARRYGVAFDTHDDRYARTSEWLKVVDGAWNQSPFSFAGKYYMVDEAVVAPPPVQTPARPRPPVYAGGESEAARNMIAALCDGYVMHGDTPDAIAARIADMATRREHLAPAAPPLLFGLSAYSIVRDTIADAEKEIARITDVNQSRAGYGNYQQWLDGTQLEKRVTLEEYSVSNRGLRTGLVGTPEDVKAKIAAFEAVGVGFFLLQCSPQREEMERFAAQIIHG